MVLANGTQAAPGVLSVAVEGMPAPQAPPPTVSIGATDPDNEDVPMIDKAQAVERLKQARKRRAQQLKKWNQYEKQLEKDAQKKKKLLAAASQQLDSESPASRSRRIMFSQNLLLLEAASRGDLDEVATLLAHGISPDSANEDGLTALHQCCIDDNEAMCRLLLQYHAKVDAVDSELWTPLHAAATCGHANICKVLIENGANLVAVNGDGNMAYDICEDEYTLSYIESEMAKRGITQEQIDDMRGERERQTLAELKQWLADGGDVDVIVDTRSGATILHVAAANGWLIVCEYALSQGATVEVEDRDGWQPIHVAACWGYVDEVQMLVEYGADPEVRTRGSESILELCEDEELRRRLAEIKSSAERRPRVTRARASPKIQNNHHLATVAPSVTLTNGADVATNLTVANAPPASPNLGSRNNGSVRMRTSFSHGSPSTNGSAIANTNRNSIRRSSLRRSSMRQKSMMSQREAEADGELRQQAAEALAVANGRGPLLADADSVDDLDGGDPSAQNRGMLPSGGASNQTSDLSISIRRNEPLTSSQNKIATANISSQAVAYSAEKYARPNSPAQADEPSRTTLNGNASESAAVSNSRTVTPQPQNANNNNEKKSVLKNTGGTTSSLQATNRDTAGTELNNQDNPNQRKAQKGKGCCVIS